MKKGLSGFLVLLVLSSTVAPIVHAEEETTSTQSQSTIDSLAEISSNSTSQETQETSASSETQEASSSSASSSSSSSSSTEETTVESSETTESSEEVIEFDEYFPSSPTEEDLAGDKVLPGEIPFVDNLTRARSSSINSEIIRNLASGTFKRPTIEKNWRTYSMFPYESGTPLGIVVHETANPNSTIDGEIAYMDRNWQNAFVHAFADQNKVIEIHDPAYGAWGAGRVANRYYMHIELVEHVGNRTAFMKSILNDAYYCAVKLQQFGLKPSRPSGKAGDTSGTVWSHHEVSSYLGATNHTDPTGYFAKFGYSMADFFSLVEYEYEQLDQTPPQIKSATVTDINSKAGTFKVRVEASAKSGIAQVQVPVWTGSDQSDLKWLNADRQKDGSYEVTVNSKNFETQDGPFNIHVYVKSNAGLQSVTNLAPITFDRVAPTVLKTAIQNLNNQTGTFDVVASVQAPQCGLKSVTVPVWSKANQSDLVWYEAKLQSDGTYKATVNAQNHNNSNGPYTVHLYATSNQDVATSVNVGKASFDLPKPTINTKITDTTGKNDEFLISTELVNYSKVKSVRFPVWSNNKGQDDLKWYTATYNTKTKRWEAKVKIKDHKDSGKYNVHAYVDYTNGKSDSHGTDGFTVQPLKIEGKYTVGENGKAQIDITVPTNLSITEVKVPIWSKSNQSDLKWYTAKSLGNGKYRADFDYKNHSYNTGKYTIHVYATATNGLNSSASFGQMTIKRPNFSLTTEIKDTNGKNTEYLLSANVNNYPGIKGVRFPVWSNNKGQDDIKWYTATYNASTKRWEAKVKVKDHKDSGKYSVHAYVDYTNGQSESYGTDGFTVQPLKIEGKYTVGENGKAQIDITVPTNLSITEVKVPIWSKSNQSDLKWYTAKSLGNGKYRADFDYKNHNYNTGKYTIHVYATATNGLNSSVSFGQMTIKKPTLSLQTQIKDINGKNEEYLLSANVNNYPGIKGVRFPVWSNNKGQDDLKWYTATYNTKTKRWEAKVKIKDHKDTGKYNVHVYLDYVNGTSDSHGSDGFTVNAPKVTGTANVSKNESGKAKIIIETTSASPVNRVRVPIWSKNNQSDIKWYDAKSIGNGKYQVDFDYRNHQLNIGNYNIHVYVRTNNGVEVSFALDKMKIPGITGSGTEADFFNRILKPVKEVADSNKLYPSVMLAQAALESGYGESDLAKKANNYFGVKGMYNGNFYEKLSNEFIDGEMTPVRSKFRKYPTLRDSIVDNALKLRQGPNTNFGDKSWDGQYYAGTWKENAKTYKNATAALTGKYAGDKDYDKKLNDIIERYNLSSFDY